MGNDPHAARAIADVNADGRDVRAAAQQGGGAGRDHVASGEYCQRRVRHLLPLVPRVRKKAGNAGAFGARDERGCSHSAEARSDTQSDDCGHDVHG